MGTFSFLTELNELWLKLFSFFKMDGFLTGFCVYNEFHYNRVQRKSIKSFVVFIRRATVY